MARWATSDMPSARISPRIGMHLFCYQIYHLLKEFYINFQTFDDTNNHLLHPLHLEQWNSHQDFASWTTRVFHSLTPSHPPAQLGMTWGDFATFALQVIFYSTLTPLPGQLTEPGISSMSRSRTSSRSKPASSLFTSCHLSCNSVWLGISRLISSQPTTSTSFSASCSTSQDSVNSSTLFFSFSGRWEKDIWFSTRALPAQSWPKNQNYLNFNLKKMGFTCSVGTGEDSRKMKIPSVTPSNGVQSRQKNTFTVMTGTVHFISANQL